MPIQNSPRSVPAIITIHNWRPLTPFRRQINKKYIQRLALSLNPFNQIYQYQLSQYTIQL